MAVTLYALSGLARSGATRSGYTSPNVFVSVNGVQYATGRAVDTNKVLYDAGLVITENARDTANTAAFTMKGAEPTEGQDVVVTLGSKNNLDRQFAGVVINRTHGYVDTPGNWNAPINAIDYTWHLTRRRFSGSYTNAAPADIAAAIVAVVPGFTLSVQSGLANITAFSQTDVTALQALTALAKAIGGYCEVDYHKVVKLFTSDSTVTNPVSLTSAHVSLSEFQFTKDLSQVRTRIFYEGGGVTALTQVSAGDSILPLSTVAWYNASGGTVKSGAQHITYTGVTVGGGGAIVGPGVSPSVAPTATLRSGSGLGSGIYKHAYTDVTASGETLPSPLGTVTTGVSLPDPSVAPTISNHGGTADFWGNGTTIYFAYSYSFAATALDFTNITALSPSSLGLVTNGTQIDISLPYNTDPNCTFVQIGYATSAAGPFGYNTLLGGQSCLQVANVPAGGTLTATLSAASLGGGANLPTTNSTTAGNKVYVTGIAPGATGTTSRKVYRTAVGASQLKLLATLADNTTTTYVDSTADGSLGANAPTSDTSALTQPTGQVLAGSTSLLLAGAGAFSTSGGWAVIGNGQQVIRYTGISGNTLTGIPASGTGAITATISYNTTATTAPALTGIATSGAGSIVYAILQGDQVNLLVKVDDTAAQTALAALIGGGDDGIVEDYLQDGTIGETEARARATARLALLSTAQVSITYKSRDKNTHAGRSVTVSLGSPTNLSGTFLIQHVTVDTFQPAIMPTFTVQASSDRFSLEDLLRMITAQAA